MPPPKGTVNNPTGKGGFQKGNGGGWGYGAATSAGKRISQELGVAALEKDGAHLKSMCEWIVAAAADGKSDDRRWAAEFLMDRLVGRPVQAVAVTPLDERTGDRDSFVAWLAAATGMVIDGETRQ